MKAGAEGSRKDAETQREIQLRNTIVRVARPKVFEMGVGGVLLAEMREHNAIYFLSVRWFGGDVSGGFGFFVSLLIG